MIRFPIPILFLLGFFLAMPAFAATKAKTVEHRLSGKASWYGREFKKTASGERYDPSALTAAHRTLPFGTKVKVTNLKNERSVTVRINNRGPYARGRVIDVSQAAAKELQMVKAGVVPVRLEVVSK